MISTVTCLAIPGDYTDVDFSTHLILQSNDEPAVEFAVRRNAAKRSELIKDMIEDAQEGERTVIPIPNVNGMVLTYVINYLEHHCENPAAAIPKPLTGKFRTFISEWDYLFIFTDLIKNGVEKDHKLLIDCMLAANFLAIKDLLNLTAAAMASIIREKAPCEVREVLGIEDDIPEEEKEEMKKQNRWCSE